LISLCDALAIEGGFVLHPGVLSAVRKPRGEKVGRQRRVLVPFLFQNVHDTSGKS
jgi:hypothetical protein